MILVLKTETQRNNKFVRIWINDGLMICCQVGFRDKTSGNGQKEDRSGCLQARRERENGGEDPSNKRRQRNSGAGTSGVKVGSGPGKLVYCLFINFRNSVVFKKLVW